MNVLQEQKQTLLTDVNDALLNFGTADELYPTQDVQVPVTVPTTAPTEATEVPATTSLAPTGLPEQTQVQSELTGEPQSTYLPPPPITDMPSFTELPRYEPLYSGDPIQVNRDAASSMLIKLKTVRDPRDSLLGSQTPNAPVDPFLSTTTKQAWHHYLLNPIPGGREGYLEVFPNYYVKNVGTLGGAFDWLLTPFRAGYGLIADTQRGYYMLRRFLASTPGGIWYNDTMEQLQKIQSGEAVINGQPVPGYIRFTAGALRLTLSATYLPALTGDEGLDEAIYLFNQPNMFRDTRDEGASGRFISMFPNLTAATAGAWMSSFETTAQTRHGSDLTFSLGTSAEFTNPYSGTFLGWRNPFTGERIFDIEKWANNESWTPIATLPGGATITTERLGAAGGFAALFLSDVLNPVNLLLDIPVDKAMRAIGKSGFWQNKVNPFLTWSRLNVPIQDIFKRQAIDAVNTLINPTITWEARLRAQLSGKVEPAEIDNIVERTKAGMPGGRAQTFASPEEASDALARRLQARGYEPEQAANIAQRVQLALEDPIEYSRLVQEEQDVGNAQEAAALIREIEATKTAVEAERAFDDLVRYFRLKQFTYNPDVTKEQAVLIQDGDFIVWDSDNGYFRPADAGEITVLDVERLNSRNNVFVWDGDTNSLKVDSPDRLTVEQFQYLHEQHGFYWDGDKRGFSAIKPDEPIASYEQYLEDARTVTYAEAAATRFDPTTSVPDDVILVEARDTVKPDPVKRPATPTPRPRTAQDLADGRPVRTDIDSTGDAILYGTSTTPVEVGGDTVDIEALRASTAGLEAPDAPVYEAPELVEPGAPRKRKTLRAEDYRSRYTPEELQARLDKYLEVIEDVTIEIDDLEDVLRQADEGDSTFSAKQLDEAEEELDRLKRKRSKSITERNKIQAALEPEAPPAPSASLAAEASPAIEAIPTPSASTAVIPTPTNLADTAITPAELAGTTEATPVPIVPPAVPTELTPTPTAPPVVAKTLVPQSATREQLVKTLQDAGLKTSGNDSQLRARVQRFLDGTLTPTDKYAPAVEVPPGTKPKLTQQERNLRSRLDGVNKALSTLRKQYLREGVYVMPPEAKVTLHHLEEVQYEAQQALLTYQSEQAARRVVTAEQTLDVLAVTRRAIDAGEWSSDLEGRIRSDANRLEVNSNGSLEQVAQRVRAKAVEERATVDDMTVAELRKKLSLLGVSVRGEKKAELQALLRRVYDDMQYAPPEATVVADNPLAIAADEYNSSLMTDDAAKAASRLTDQFIHEQSKEVDAALTHYSAARTQAYQAAVDTLTDAKKAQSQVRAELDTQVQEVLTKASKAQTPPTSTPEVVKVPKVVTPTPAATPAPTAQAAGAATGKLNLFSLFQEVGRDYDVLYESLKTYTKSELVRSAVSYKLAKRATLEKQTANELAELLVKFVKGQRESWGTITPEWKPTSKAPAATTTPAPKAPEAQPAPAAKVVEAPVPTSKWGEKTARAVEKARARLATASPAMKSHYENVIAIGEEAIAIDNLYSSSFNSKQAVVDRLLRNPDVNSKAWQDIRKSFPLETAAEAPTATAATTVPGKEPIVYTEGSFEDVYTEGSFEDVYTEGSFEELQHPLDASRSSRFNEDTESLANLERLREVGAWLTYNLSPQAEAYYQGMPRELQDEIKVFLAMEEENYRTIEKLRGLTSAINAALKVPPVTYMSISDVIELRLPRDVFEELVYRKLAGFYTKGKVYVSPFLREEYTVQTLTHEYGHHIARTEFSGANANVRAAVESEYEAAIGKNADSAINTIRSANRANFTKVADMTDEYRDYATSFDEWFAQQVAKWFESSVEPASLVEQFFAGVARKLSELYVQVANFFGVTDISEVVPISTRRFLDNLLKTELPTPSGVREEVSKQFTLAGIRALEPYDQIAEASALFKTSDVPVHELRAMLNMSDEDFMKALKQLEQNEMLELIADDILDMTPTDITEAFTICGVPISFVRFL